MKKFEVYRELPNARALVRAEFKDLYPGERLVVCKGDREWDAVAETRTFGGVVVRVVMER